MNPRQVATNVILVKVPLLDDAFAEPEFLYIVVQNRKLEISRPLHGSLTVDASQTETVPKLGLLLLGNMNSNISSSRFK